MMHRFNKPGHDNYLGISVVNHSLAYIHSRLVVTCGEAPGDHAGCLPGDVLMFHEDVLQMYTSARVGELYAIVEGLMGPSLQLA
jgi:hypothetical protein